MNGGSDDPVLCRAVPPRGGGAGALPCVEHSLRLLWMACLSPREAPLASSRRQAHGDHRQLTAPARRMMSLACSGSATGSSTTGSATGRSVGRQPAGLVTGGAGAQPTWSGWSRSCAPCSAPKRPSSGSAGATCGASKADDRRGASARAVRRQARQEEAHHQEHCARARMREYMVHEVWRGIRHDRCGGQTCRNEPNPSALRERPV